MNLANDIARDKIININKILNQLNERHEYLRTWLITLSSLLSINEAGLIIVKFFRVVKESSEATKPKAVN